MSIFFTYYVTSVIDQSLDSDVDNKYWIHDMCAWVRARADLGEPCCKEKDLLINIVQVYSNQVLKKEVKNEQI